ncbi:MAG: response regulator [Cyclobacteriaceae bacterium]
MTILLVDDDQDDLEIFQEAAAMVVPGITCLTAQDGNKSLALLETLSPLPKYIFLDVNMPKMDGKEFLQIVKNSPRWKDISIIIYSTSTHKSEFGQFFKLGVSHFITKPSEFNLLVTYLKAILL